MESYFSISLCFLLLGSQIFGQAVCGNDIKIESPVVPKPKEAGIELVSCSQLVVRWKGTIDQTYVIGGTYTEIASNITHLLNAAENISCDNSLNCTAVIPVNGGTLVTWSVQAISILDGRTFYSYVLRGSQNVLIPQCIAPQVNKSESKTEDLLEGLDKIVGTERLIIYPNPVHFALNVNVNAFNKDGVLQIVDVNGKTIISRQTTSGNMRIDVSKLSKGIYILAITSRQGKVLYKAKFIKE